MPRLKEVGKGYEEQDSFVPGGSRILARSRSYWSG